MQKLIKKKMIDAGRDDFITYLAELLQVTRQTASDKLNGRSCFTSEELATLTVKLGFTGDELRNAIIK